VLGDELQSLEAEPRHSEFFDRILEIFAGPGKLSHGFAGMRCRARRLAKPLIDASNFFGDVRKRRGDGLLSLGECFHQVGRIGAKLYGEIVLRDQFFTGAPNTPISSCMSVSDTTVVVGNFSAIAGWRRPPDLLIPRAAPIASSVALAGGCCCQCSLSANTC